MYIFDLNCTWCCSTSSLNKLLWKKTTFCQKRFSFTKQAVTKTHIPFHLKFLQPCGEFNSVSYQIRPESPEDCVKIWCSHHSPWCGMCLVCRNSRTDWRSHREMGLMNAIGLQPRHPAPTVTSQGTQTQTLRLQNAETQTDRDLPDEVQLPSTSQGSQVTDGKTLCESEYHYWAQVSFVLEMKRQILG